MRMRLLCLALAGTVSGALPVAAQSPDTDGLGSPHVEIAPFATYGAGPGSTFPNIGFGVQLGVAISQTFALVGEFSRFRSRDLCLSMFPYFHRCQPNSVVLLGTLWRVRTRTTLSPYMMVTGGFVTASPGIGGRTPAVGLGAGGALRLSDERAFRMEAGVHYTRAFNAAWEDAFDEPLSFAVLRVGLRIGL